MKFNSKTFVGLIVSFLFFIPFLFTQNKKPQKAKDLVTLIKEKSGLEIQLEDLSWEWDCLLYTSPSPRDKRQSRMPSSA